MGHLFSVERALLDRPLARPAACGRGAVPPAAAPAPVRLRTAVLASLATGLLLWAAGPAVGAGWLAWAAIIPAAVVAVRRPDTRTSRLAIPLAYAVYLELLLVPALPFGLARKLWGEPPVPILVGDSPVVFAALVAVPLFGLGLYALRFPHPSPPGLIHSRLRGLEAIAVPALAWTALDLIRVKFDPAGLWGPLFLSQHDLPTAQLAMLAGPWLLTFAIVAVNYAAALAIAPGSRRLPTAAGLASLIMAILLTLAALQAAQGKAGRAVRVAAVQPGYNTAEFERPVLRYMRRRNRNYELASLDLIRDLGRLTRQAARQGAEVVVWPEAVVWVDPHVTQSTRRSLARLTASTGAAVVVPYFLRARSRGAAVVAKPTGGLTRDQPKQRPMWFLGEHGDTRVPPRPVATRAGALGTMLGVDNQDPGSARRLAAAGAAILSSSTHDWQELAPQQRAFSQLHARALRRPLVRADWRFGSAIFDARGRTRADAGRETRRIVLVAAVTPGGAATPYQRLGDAFAWASLLALAALWLAARWLRSSEAQRAQAERAPDPRAEA